MNARQSEFLRYVAGSGEQMLELTDDLPRFSRLGQQPVLKDFVAVTTLVREIFRDLLLGSAGRATIELRVAELPDAFASCTPLILIGRSLPTTPSCLRC